MKNIFSKIKGAFGSKGMEDEAESGYVELDSGSGDESRQKVIIRPFTLTDFQDVKPVLDSLRDGNTIALINIAPLKERDIVELKRSVNKLKKTADAMNGALAGFGEDWIVIAPSFAEIHRQKPTRSSGDSMEVVDEEQ